MSFGATLFFHYVGEEGVFTLNSMEMWQHNEFLSVVMYGNVGGRPPLFSWLMIPVSLIIGWEHVLVAARIVTVAATIGTSLIVAWLAHQLWRDKSVSITSALFYLIIADVMMYRGWLSYADPLFSMFIVLSIALVWVSCLKNSYLLLALSMLTAFSAFLSKSLTIYIFLCISMLVLTTDLKYRRFLLGWRTWGIYAIGMLLPVIWLKLVTSDVAQGAKMSNDMLEKLVIPDMGSYLLRLIVYPAEMLLRMMPLTLFVGYFLFRKREIIKQIPAVRIALFIALFNFLPYMLAPQGSVRYVIPVYSFVALAAAYLVVRQPHPFKINKWIIGMLVLGSTMNLIISPYYQKNFRGENYVQMAKEINDKYGQYPLYATNVSSVGLSIVANIDSMNFDRPALNWPPNDFKEGIVIAYTENDVPGKLLRILSNHGDKVYLICRGLACAAQK